MFNNRGNFLLQALLALTLIFAFMPLVARRLAARDADAAMYAVTRQASVATTAARIYVRENVNALPYNTTILSGNMFVDTLEPYGLPLGFVPVTAMGQDMSLVISKNADYVTAYLDLSGGGLTQLQRAELARRIGFYAEYDTDSVQVGVVLDDTYSDIVRRNDKNLDGGAFLTDLDMGGFVFDNAGRTVARRGEFDSGQFGTLTITGIENGRKVRSNIEKIAATKTVFQSKTGEAALSLSRGSLVVGSANLRTISRFGDTGNLTTNTASVYDFSMTAGRSSFYGPPTWNVGGDVLADNISFNTERLEISSYINAARGQDVYINPDELEYSTQSGMSVGTIAASNITMRDQTSDAMTNGQSGAVIVDIRPAGTSVLPDVLIDGISNDALAIIKEPLEDSGDTVTCKSVIDDLDGHYNAKSLAQYILCQYVYWQRLEKRIDAKQCMLAGGGDCD